MQGERLMPENTQKTAVTEEYLGDISTEFLLQNLTNTNRNWSSIDAIRLAVPNGFTITAEIERRVLETEEDRARWVAETNAYMRRTGREPEQPGKLIRLILEPSKTSEGVL
jgi:hypothetical protein